VGAATLERQVDDLLPGRAGFLIPELIAVVEAKFRSRKQR